MECLFVTISITNIDVSITVGAVYRPPSGIIKKLLNEMEAFKLSYYNEYKSYLRWKQFLKLKNCQKKIVLLCLWMT